MSHRMPMKHSVSVRLWWLLVPLVWAAAVPRAVAESSAKERELLAILAGDTDEGSKAIACKQLAIHGTAAAVEPLATLLANERLESWARIALEAIPGPEADDALHRAVAVLTGRRLIGVINTLGVRGDRKAVPLLSPRLAGEDDAVAAAAAAALGRIGGDAAIDALRSRLTASDASRRDMVAEALVVAAERLIVDGRREQAVTVCDVVRTAEVSDQRRAEAMRVAIIARGRDGLPLLAEAFGSPSRRLFTMAVATARELPRGAGEEAAAIDTTVAAGVEAMHAGTETGQRAIVLLDVLAERRGVVALPLVLQLAREGALPVRLAAIAAAGRMGDVAVIEPLLAAAGDPDAGVAAAARAAIAGLSGDAIDAALLERLSSSDPAVLVAVVEAVGARRIGAGDRLVPLVDHSDEAVRIAAIRGLGGVGDLGHLEVIIAHVRSPRSDTEAEAARLALKAAAVRMPDREACGARLVAALAGLSEATDVAVVLLETLAEVGGREALAAVRTAATSGDRRLEDAATRLLGKWMTDDAATVLKELATTKDATFRGRALRGYVRIARQFTMPDEQRAAMCREALAMASDAEERRLVVEILSRYPSDAMLEVAREAEKMPGVEAEAKAASTAIRDKLASKSGG